MAKFADRLVRHGHGDGAVLIAIESVNRLTICVHPCPVASIVVMEQPVLNENEARCPSFANTNCSQPWHPGLGEPASRAREKVRVELERVGVGDGWSRVSDRSTLARHAGDGVERARRRGYETNRRLGRNIVVVAHIEGPGPAPRRHGIGRRLSCCRTSRHSLLG